MLCNLSTMAKINLWGSINIISNNVYIYFIIIQSNIVIRSNYILLVASQSKYHLNENAE